MRRLTLFITAFTVSLICFGCFCVSQVFADDCVDTDTAPSSSSLESSNDEDGKVTYKINYPAYKTAGNRKWNSSTQKYYYITDSINCEVIWRLYNPYSGEHLYTKSLDEYNYLGTIGWKKENIAWISPLSSKTQVYRLYNPYSGDHHYTTNLDEYNYLGKIGWKQEGRGFYSDDAHGVAVWRLFNPYVTVGTHHYTKDKDEYDYLGKIGWRQEKVGWYSVNHTTHTWTTVEYADKTAANSIRYTWFCLKDECELLNGATNDTDPCPANANHKYNRVKLYVHQKTMCTVCGLEK